MANSNPHQGRLARKRRRKPGDLQAVQRLLWTALLEAESVLLDAEDSDQRLRAVHAVSQASGQYVKLLEVGEFEARLAELETRLAPQGPHHA